MSVFSSLFISCSKPQQPPLSEAKADAEQLLKVLMPLSEQVLQQRLKFFPFAGRMAPDGTIAIATAYRGKEEPPSQALIDLLREEHKQEARAKKLRACAIIYDHRTVWPSSTRIQDCVVAEIDHFSGYSAVFEYPYFLSAEKKLEFEPRCVEEGTHSIFDAPKQSTP